MNPCIPERSDSVLGSVIRAYVSSARPVGSRSVADGLHLSPATIRSEFADLERRGFLTHPHTSAGRIPTDQGYRLYVDRLLQARRLTLGEQQAIQREYEHGRSEIEALMRKTARILSAMTRLAGVALYHAPEELTLDRFRIVPLGPRQLMIVLVLGDVWVEKEVVRLEEPLKAGELMRVTRLLNKRFAGLPLLRIRGELLAELERSRDDRLAILQTVVDLLDGALGVQEDHFFVEGASRLVEQPEFREPRAMESILRAVEGREEWAKAFGTTWDRPGLRIEIGGEMREPLLRGCSFVHVPCRWGGRTVGSFGVLGPTRMSYDRVAGIVEHVSSVLSDALTERGN